MRKEICTVAMLHKNQVAEMIIQYKMKRDGDGWRWLGVLGSNEGPEFVLLRGQRHLVELEETEGIFRVNISTVIAAWSIARYPHDQTKTERKKQDQKYYSFPASSRGVQILIGLQVEIEETLN